MNLPSVIPPMGWAGLRSPSNPASILLLDSLLRGLGVVDDPLLLSDLPLQLGDVFPDAPLLLCFSARELALSIRETVLEGLELPLRRRPSRPSGCGAGPTRRQRRR